MRQVPLGSLPGKNGTLININSQDAVKAFINCSESDAPDHGADVAVADLHIAGCEECQIYLLAREQEKRAMH